MENPFIEAVIECKCQFVELRTELEHSAHPKLGFNGK